jgi:hypothetical protein
MLRFFEGLVVVGDAGERSPLTIPAMSMLRQRGVFKKGKFSA